MNDNIKEILDNIKNKYDGYLVCDIVSGDDLKLLLDYINQLQSNWNSLREWIKENSWYYNTSDGCQWVDQFKLLDKMNELESSDSKCN